MSNTQKLNLKSEKHSNFNQVSDTNQALELQLQSVYLFLLNERPLLKRQKKKESLLKLHLYNGSYGKVTDKKDLILKVLSISNLKRKKDL